MDHLTSRSLSWMIKNCENPKAVEITLQSIAGADHALPFGPLFDSNAVTLIAQRVENSFASQQLSTKDVDGLAEMDPGQHQAVIVYARALDLCFSQMGKFADLGKQVRQIVRPLDGFYSRLLNDRSIPVSAVGTIGWSLAYSRSVYGENPFGEEDTRRKVDRLSGLIEFAQTRHTRLPSHTHLLFDLLYVLSRHIFMFASKSGDDTRQIMIKGMIAALSPSSVETLRITSVAHSCAVAALGLNTSLRAHFSTLDRSLVDSSNGYLAVSGHSRIMIEDLNPECLLLLGLAGLVEAFGDSGCAGAELGILNVVMQRLNELRVDWRRQAAFEPLVSASAFDLRRYVVETVSKCYIQQLASSPSNPSVSLFQCTDVLGNILSLVWDDMSWLLDVALTLRAGSPHKGLRDKIVGLLALHTEAVVQHPHIHDMLYEMFAGVGDESLGYFNSADGAYLHGITHHFHDITSTHSIDAKRVNTITTSLLQRLVRDGLLETLIYCAYGADDRDLHDAFWRGIRCGPTTCFWGEQTIMLARKSVSQLGAPSDMGTRSISDLLRDFCLTQGERIHGSGGAKEVGYVRRTDEVWSRELQGHLEDFKAVLLHELNAPVHQTQPQKRLRWQTMPIAGRAILEEVNQRVDRSYIALEVLKT
ncbi:hypothetical protein BDV93DRAFT_481598 [Ceratobasidium sp. AG-I]|nr:hypothetical protein BDV93DRAFT_481598 [Ceratobasidium sp. AG-I]